MNFIGNTTLTDNDLKIMKNLKTKYMGIEIDNPIILGASNLVTKQGNLRKAEDQGVGAIVYKSLFEEQIQLEKLQQVSSHHCILIVMQGQLLFLHSTCYTYKATLKAIIPLNLL